MIAPAGGRNSRLGPSPIAAAFVGFVVAGPACAPSAAEGPGPAVAGFGKAIERGDYHAAYAATSADFQARVSFDAFATPFQQDPAAARALGEALDAQAEGLPARVDLDTSAGPVTLIVEHGRWRVDRAPVELWGQSTPRVALRTFVHALEQRRYDVILRLVPNRYRGGLTSDALRSYWEDAVVDAAGPHPPPPQAVQPARPAVPSDPKGTRRGDLLTRLRAALSAPIAEAGDEARLPLEGGRAPVEVRFLREDGRWKIDSLE